DITSVISVVYYFNVVRQMFFLPPAEETATSRVRTTPGLALALGISVVGTLLLGLFPQPFLSLANFGQRMITAFISLL
ncbi:MAG TPA: hypothetical protein VER55_13690, partial [Ardenticatenaceae bacterium]|nr:hypothetical protein [Ardenticatenaceae bacterium]